MRVGVWVWMGVGCPCLPVRNPASLVKSRTGAYLAIKGCVCLNGFNWKVLKGAFPPLAILPRLVLAVYPALIWHWLSNFWTHKDDFWHFHNSYARVMKFRWFSHENTKTCYMLSFDWKQKGKFGREVVFGWGACWAQHQIERRRAKWVAKASLKPLRSRRTLVGLSPTLINWSSWFYVDSILCGETPKEAGKRMMMTQKATMIKTMTMS